MSRKFIISLLSILVLIPLGMYSHRISCLPNETGDALWAMVLFCFCRMIWVKKNLISVALISIIISFLIEFSQMLTWRWLVSLRHTYLGALIIGGRFDWWDLLAYTIGILLICWLFKRLKG